MWRKKRKEKSQHHDKFKVPAYVYDAGKGSSGTTYAAPSSKHGGVGSAWTSGNGDAGSNKAAPTIEQSRPTTVADTLNAGTTKRALQRSETLRAGDEAYLKLCDEVRRSGRLWEDPDFPATSKSVYPTQPNKRIEWKRPKDIVEKPAFFSDGVSRFDVQQGELGDCWLLAAIASLSMHEDLFYRVVPANQGFKSDQYCGAFHFKLWQFGQWRDVIVDDRLPTSNGRLIFMQSTDKREFWSALLEKAYAKINGCYEALIGGTQAEAMEDFTGGLCETIDLTNPPDNLEDMMKKAAIRCSLMGCSIEPDDDEIEAKLPNGLIMGHAYSVTDARNIRYQGSDLTLVRVRNPWGDSSEWRGRWSDSSREWKNIDESQKKDLGLQFEDDGEFWMNYQDFVGNFTKLEICHLGPESLDNDELGGKPKRRWEMCIETGFWKRNVNAGGCRNFLQTFWTNPQFRVEVIDPDEDDDEDLGTIIVGLMQKDVRRSMQEFHTIGYCIYKLKDPGCGPLDLKFFRFNTSCAKSPSFINQREICGRHKLPPGHYCILPTTFKPNEEADFILRIFSERPNDTAELDAQNNYDNVAASITTREEEPDDERLRQEAALKQSFLAFAGPAGYITAFHLKDILNATVKKEVSCFEGFNVEVCRSMIAIYDLDQSGRMEYDEFKTLWRDLRLWKGIFKEHDFDGSGSFNAHELRMALESAGFSVSNKLLMTLVNRYADPEQGLISFEDYLLCTVRLVTCFDLFKAQPKDGARRAMFEEEEFLRCFMYV